MTQTFSQNETNGNGINLFSSNYTAIKYTSYLNYKFNIDLKENYFFKHKKYSLASNKSLAIPEPVKHVAFFCKLEDKFFDEFNIWLKFRAGDDDAYRKLIKAP